ncbi:MAG: hypothetical protein HBSAPP04_28220 [Ignavibacteriaceae bacterium]|nr:MAG: hypothetical protein HBSAPP04_28220 [Ignavibacteriaceae bacterium]
MAEVPADLFRKIRQLEIRTKGIVNTMFSGEYRSSFKGQGIEFSEVREYNYGDDIRMIDWNVSARQGKPFVKIYHEEREQTLMLMVDASGSLWFGSKYPLKYEMAIQLSAVLAFSAIKNNDKVGLCIFSDRIERYIAPRKGRTHVLRVLRELFSHQPEQRPTRLGLVSEYISRVLKRRAIVFLISDFDDTGFEKEIKILNQKHDLIAVMMRDMGELIPPRIGLATVRDPETGETTTVDFGNKRVREEFRQYYLRQHKESAEYIKKLHIDSIELFTHHDFVEKLMAFFRMRGRRN